MCIFCSTFARFFGRMGLKPVQTLKTFETIKTLFINSLCWAVVARK